jgi:ABC-type oligopeptide transport system substrate-binding subunit
VVAVLAGLACTAGASGGSAKLAGDQTLRFAIKDDVATLDPARASGGPDITFVQELFSGLYRLDNANRVVPDLATGMPEVSPDSRTYTFLLRRNARFSNGVPVTSADILYSWNRAAYLGDAYASIFEPIDGFEDVSGHRATTMRGLTTPDDHTVKAKLTHPSGYLSDELALPVAGWIVDRGVVGGYADPSTGRPETWWTDPSTLVGSGPFTMVQRTPNASMDFAPVKHWWGGSTGALTKIHVDIGPDATGALKKLETGGYSLFGMGGQGPGASDVLRYRTDPAKTKMLTIWPAARTTWMGMNFTAGPFAPRAGITPGDPTARLGRDAGSAGRDAFSRAIDRTELANIACAEATTCTPATGGYIAKGLKGYLGDGADRHSRFDPAAAKAEYQRWDPAGTKVRGLQIDYSTSTASDSVWGNVQSQLQANLGVKVELNPMDLPTQASRRSAKQSILYSDAWNADYDHPQDWFDNLFACSAAPVGRGNGSGYCNPTMDELVRQADATQDVRQAIPSYERAERMMLDDVNGTPLLYLTQPYIVQPYVHGAGYSGILDYRWEGVKILEH